MRDRATARGYLRPPARTCTLNDEALGEALHHNRGPMSAPESDTPQAASLPDPYKWLRRGIEAALILAATAFCIYAFGRSPDQSDVNPVHDPAVLAEVPPPGSNVPRQSQVGAKLQPGYDGRISINGIEIPEDQMDGAVPTTSKEYDPRLGVRPNRRELVLFTPGPGKVIDRYGSREVTITVTFWRIIDGPDDSRAVTWTIYVS